MPIAPRRPPTPCSTTLAPSRSWFSLAAVTAVGVVAVLGPALLVLAPDVGAAGPVAAEHVVVRERVAEEVRTFDAAFERDVFVFVTHERGDARDVRIHRVADRDALLVERLVVVVDPVLRFLGVDERERERADAFLRGEVDRVTPAARDPQRRVRLLARLRHDVARRHRDELARVAGERLLGEAPHGDAQAFFPHAALRLGIDLETAELGFRRRLTGAEVDAPVRDEVERGDALGDPRRVVERGRRLHDAVPEPDVLRSLRRRREEHFGRAGVRVLLEEVVLDFPDVLEPELVGELDLVECVLEQLILGVSVPGARELVLVEDAELHGAPKWSRGRGNPRGSPSDGRCPRSNARSRPTSSCACSRGSRSSSRARCPRRSR